MNLTDASITLFKDLWNDAPNWSGTPLVEVSKEERGNLTQLKRAKLLTTTTSDGEVFAYFTDAGRAFASSLGLGPLGD